MARGLLLLFCLNCLLFSAPALGSEEGGYIGLHGGGLLLGRSQNSYGQESFDLDYEAGYGTSLVLGYDLGSKYPHLGEGRLELEVGYRKNELEESSFPQGTFDAEGDVSALSIMFNSFGEYRENPPWIPYVGFGLGYAVVSVEDVRIDGVPLTDDEDGVFAWMAGAGLGYRLSDIWTFDLGYRLLGTTSPRFHLEDGSGLRLRSEYLSHLFSLGLRLRL